MKIAIIGAGKVGRALAGSAVRAGHVVTISAANPQHARDAAKTTGARAASSNTDAVTPADVVILAVPYAEVDGVLEDLGRALDGKVVVDATNPLNATYSGLAVDGASAAEHIQARVPAARVAKAFNTIFAARQADPIVNGMPVDGYVAADDDAAKATVLALVASLGFRPVDAGPLSMAQALENLALLNITLQARTGGSWQSAWRLVEPSARAA